MLLLMPDLPANLTAILISPRCRAIRQDVLEQLGVPDEVVTAALQVADRYRRQVNRGMRMAGKIIAGNVPDVTCAEAIIVCQQELAERHLETSNLDAEYCIPHPRQQLVLRVEV